MQTTHPEKPPIEVTRQMLRAWGRWYNRILISHLDQSEKSLMGLIADYKGTIIRGTNHDYMIDDDEAEQIDELINKLKRQKPKRAQVLKVHYTEYNYTKEKIARLNIPRRTYYYHLKKGEQWLHKILY